MKSRTTITLLFLLACPMLLFAQGGQRYYVDAGTLNSMQNGSSWATALTDLQQALALAGAGDTIWVAQGVYRPTQTPDRSISFVIPNGVSILGGFNGVEIEVIQRNWESNPTILSGDIGVHADSLDNSYHVVRIDGADSTTLIDGFVIMHGYAFKENDFGEANHGAGAYIGVNINIAVSTPKFINCVFIWNTAKMDGGAVYTQKLSGSMAAIPFFENCRFYENSSKQAGGAMLMNSLDPPDAMQSRISHCLFERNRAGFDGGGISYFDIVGNHIVDSCQFIQNYAFISGGSLYCNIRQFGGRLYIKHSKFENNQARKEGGAIGSNNEGLSNSNTFWLYCSNSIFINNSTIQGNGGALQFTAIGNINNLYIDKCEFRANRCNTGCIFVSGSSDGKINLFVNSSNFIDNKSLIGLSAGIYATGNLFDQSSANISITNSLFTHNEGSVLFLPGGLAL